MLVVVDSLNPPADRRDPRQSADLIQVLLEAGDWDYENGPLPTLWWRPTPDVFATAAQLCRSEVAKERRLGAAILSQLGGRERPFATGSLPLLMHLTQDGDENVVAEALMALSHHSLDQYPESMLALAAHPFPDVRFGLACALIDCEALPAVETLIRLLQDSDDDVRNWAAFGLGIRRREPEHLICDALAARLTDSYAEVRYEAITGLAEFQDTRAIVPILAELDSESPDVDLVLFAVEGFPRPEFVPGLLRLRLEAGSWDAKRRDEIVQACNSRS